MKKINKNLYYFEFFNFGDELNKYLFEKVFGVRFNYVNDMYLADYVAIGSILEWCCPKPVGLIRKIMLHAKLLAGKIKVSKITVLGSGFLTSPNRDIKFSRKMDFKIVRGKLTETYLKNHGLLKTDVLLGDLGLLCPYMIDKAEKKYKLGIIPHYYDLNSPIIYELYKRHGKDCIIINVQDDVEVVIRQITECEAILSSALHGLIVSDSFHIPNLWFENTLKYSGRLRGEMNRFKYKDYYSIYGLDNIEPIDILEITDISIDTISERYKIKKDLVDEKRRELYEYCKKHFENIKTK